MGEGRAPGVDIAFALVMSATGQRRFIRVCKADMVLETAGPQMPLGLAHPSVCPSLPALWSLSSN